MGRRKLSYQEKINHFRKFGLKKRKRVLNLPDSIWQQYQHSLESTHNGNHKNYNLLETDHLCSNNPGENIAVSQETNSIFKKLAIKVDNFYAPEYTQHFLNEKLNQSIEMHKKIRDTLLIFQKSISHCSMQVVDLGNESPVYNCSSISVDTKLQDVSKLVDEQEILLSNLQKVLQNMTIARSISNIREKIEWPKECNPIKSRWSELQFLKSKSDQLNQQLQSHNQQLVRVKRYSQKRLAQKNSYIALLKKKLRRFLIAKNKNQQGSLAEIEAHPKTTQNQILQVGKLLITTNSLLKNLVGIQIQENNCKRNPDKILESKNETIENLTKEIAELKHQKSEKNEEIKKLTVAVKEAKNALSTVQNQNKIKEKKNFLKIISLKSSLDSLNRKHDRWLTDKFHLNCHSIMLFEKLRQMEKR